MKVLPKNLLFASILLITGGCGARDQADNAPEHDAALGLKQSAAPVLYDASGTVGSITPNRKHMVVEHGDIPGFMDAMTMPFAVADTALLSNVSAEDSILFKIEVEGPKIHVISVEVVER